MIRHSQDHSSRTAAERHRAEIAMLRRFVTYPELGALHRKPRHNSAIVSIQPKDNRRSEG
jgi:hypothetical protein